MVALAPKQTEKPVVLKHLNWRRTGLVIAVCSLLLAAISLTALLVGFPTLSGPELLEIFAGGGKKLARVVVLELRLPRLCLGLLCGVALATTGVLLQDSLRNPLAGPELLGVSSGASSVIAVLVVFNLPVDVGFYPWLSLVGGLLSGGLVLLANSRSNNPVQLLLIGIAMASLTSAITTCIVSLGNQISVQVLFQYLLGSLAGRSWNYVWLVLPWIVLGLPMAWLCARPLNLLQLGDEIAEGLGLRVVQIRLLILGLSAALVAVVVSACGPIGFVALLAPHIARRLLNTNDARLVLPVSGLVGATVLCGADLLAKQLFAPLELAVGVCTILVGSPLLLLLVRRQFRGS